MKALKQCVNGCKKPPKPPSLVLCEDCLQGISDKFEDMIENFPTSAGKEKK